MTGLYSPINKLMEQVTRPKGTGAEYMAELQKKPGYKPAEAEDRDLQVLMALPQMQRAEFMEKLKAQANKYPLKMRELTGKQTHHETYTLPGGENYREILLHTPLPEGEGFSGVEHHFGGTPNILASIRVKDRLIPDTEGPHKVKVMDRNGFTTVKHKTRADAERFADIKQQGGYRTEISPMNHKKVLHLEEIQSDWHQQGREQGYGDANLQKQIAEIKAQRRQLDADYWKQAAELKNDPQAYLRLAPTKEKMAALTKQLERLEEDKEHVVPYGPHAKDWHELALKAMIQHAAENGYDQIAITPGAEQAKRFGLSKQVGSVSYNPETQHFQAFKPNRETITNEKGATPERVKALIGKEAAAKLLQAPQTMGHHYLEGEDLDIGGEGMKGFYDKMVPTFLNKFGKKHGVQVQPGAVTVPEGIESGWATKVKPAYEAPVHTFDITPGMREDVLKNGIPRYAEGGEVEVRPTVKDEAIQRKVPEMEAAAKALQAGAITRKDYDKVVQQHKPVKPYTFVPKPASDADAARALMENKKPQWRGHEQWPAGRKVGLRLDIPAYEHHGVWVNSVHDEEGSGKDKYPTAYHSVSSVKNATFDASPDKAVRVATGEQNKSPFARIKGELHHITEDEAVEHMKQHLNHPEWAQVGMDPRRHGYFYDRKTLKPVTHSEHVVQIGPLVLAKNPKYGKRETYAAGGDVKPKAERDANLARFLKDSKVKNRLYHGTTKDFKEFGHAHQYSGEGGSHSGSGFYFTDSPESASRYAVMRGETGATVKPVYLNIKKPLHFDWDQGETTGAQLKLTPAQVRSIMLAHPNIKNEDESPLTNWGDIRGANFDKTLNNAVKSYAGSSMLAALRNDFFHDNHEQWLRALHKATGYDSGTTITPKGERHYIAWFPEQIKSAIGNRGTYDISEPDITKAKGGSIKPAGNAVVKEKVTISPNMDVMQYELLTKKVK